MSENASGDAKCCDDAHRVCCGRGPPCSGHGRFGHRGCAIDDAGPCCASDDYGSPARQQNCAHAIAIENVEHCDGPRQLARPCVAPSSPPHLSSTPAPLCPACRMKSFLIRSSKWCSQRFPNFPSSSCPLQLETQWRVKETLRQKLREKRIPSGEEQEDMRPSPSTSSSSVLQRLVDSPSVYAALA